MDTKKINPRTACSTLLLNVYKHKGVELGIPRDPRCRKTFLPLSVHLASNELGAVGEAGSWKVWRGMPQDNAPHPLICLGRIIKLKCQTRVDRPSSLHSPQVFLTSREERCKMKMQNSRITLFESGETDCFLGCCEARPRSQTRHLNVYIRQ